MAVSWETIMVEMVRVLIGDLDSPPTYSDSRLETLLVVAAKYVQQELTFDTTYTITVTVPDIDPDPSATATLDDEFTNFVVLKAACLADMSTLRTKAALAGLKARCGPAVLETLQHLEGFTILIEQGPCAAYKALKKEYQYGNTDMVRAVLSPFRGNNFNPASLRTAIRQDRRL